MDFHRTHSTWEYGPVESVDGLTKALASIIRQTVSARPLLISYRFPSNTFTILADGEVIVASGKTNIVMTSETIKRIVTDLGVLPHLYNFATVTETVWFCPRSAEEITMGGWEVNFSYKGHPESGDYNPHMKHTCQLTSHVEDQGLINLGTAIFKSRTQSNTHTLHADGSISKGNVVVHQKG